MVSEPPAFHFTPDDLKDAIAERDRALSALHAIRDLPGATNPEERIALRFKSKSAEIQLGILTQLVEHIRVRLIEQGFQARLAKLQNSTLNQTEQS